MKKKPKKRTTFKSIQELASKATRDYCRTVDPLMSASKARLYSHAWATGYLAGWKRGTK